jgi:formylmethanofuran dehydrogenase subunit E
MTVELRDQEFPAFYAEAPVVTVYDPLARFLGAARQGLIEYRYADVVRLAGHSCPTVAGAYLMALHGLRALYGTETPVRGDVEVFMRDAPGSGVTGVIASVVQLVTGAAGETGFPGAGKQALFARMNLLAFGADVDGVLGMRRRDTGKAVMVHFDNAVVPWPDAMPPLMAKAFSEQASSDELEQFARLWQERVRCMLVDHADNPALVRVTEWHPAL